MIKVVLDTNVLVSASIVKGKQYELLKLVKTEKIKLILSLGIIKEFEEVINRPKFGFSKIEIEDAVKEILSLSEIVFPTTKIGIIKEDIDDNKILEAAVDGVVDYVISGDPHLLSLKNFKNIKILNTSQFFETVISKTL